VVLNGGFDATFSAEVWELATSPPVITSQPANRTVPLGQSASFSVGAAGGVTYRWRRNGTPLSDGGNISGSGTAMLVINPVGAGDAGSYDALVSNPCGTTLSAAATLTIGSGCYANCDQSTMQPLLNVNDFVCFQAAFASASPYADCNHDNALNVNDFVCFQSAFAQGCP
jgi:hypothetical protein